MFQLLRSSALEMVILTFIIALGAILLGTSQGLQKGLTVPVTITNESIAFAVNKTNVTAAYTPVTSVVQVANGTVTIPAARILISPDSTGIGIVTNTTYAVGTYDVTYTATTYPEEYNITGAGVTALFTYSSYFGILVIAIIFVAIIGIVMLIANQGKSKA